MHLAVGKLSFPLEHQAVEGAAESGLAFIGAPFVTLGPHIFQRVHAETGKQVIVGHVQAVAWIQRELSFVTLEAPGIGIRVASIGRGRPRREALRRE